jgi:hypothetical protein
LIAIICSQCEEGILGLDEENCTFQNAEPIGSHQFFILTSEGWTPMKWQAVIECPKCKSPAIIVDIFRVWREERDRRGKG